MRATLEVIVEVRVFLWIGACIFVSLESESNISFLVFFRVENYSKKVVSWRDGIILWCISRVIRKNSFNVIDALNARATQEITTTGQEPPIIKPILFLVDGQ